MLKRIFAVLAFSLPVMSVQAGPQYDFSTFAGGVDHQQDLNTTSVTLGPITAQGYVTNGTDYPLSFGAADLWARNQPGDHGLGVCSEGHDACVAGGGDVSEVSNQDRIEGILLSKDSTAWKWTDLFISSLDGNEHGWLWWSDTTSFSNRVGFAAPALGASGEGSIWGLLGADQAAIASAKYLFFTAPTHGEFGMDNDWYLWGVSAIPEPESYAMLIAGLGLMGFVARRRQRKLAA